VNPIFKFNCLIPEFSVSDFRKSLHFYTDVLGFKIQYERNEDQFAFLCLGECQIMIEAQNENWKIAELEHPYGRGINFQIEIKDIEDLYSKIIGQGYPIHFGIEEKWYRVNEEMLGVKQFLILDPDGYLLRFAEDLGSNLNPPAVE
jgi:catechol 2,3-dioxygenase-like lactoylglutathione lyase family enzyme